MKQNSKGSRPTKHKLIYRIEGMDCEACAKMIELDLEEVGIKTYCNFSKQELVFDADVNVEKVKEIIKKAGYKMVNSRD